MHTNTFPFDTIFMNQNIFRLLFFSIAVALNSCNINDPRAGQGGIKVSIKETNKILPARYNVAFLVMNGVFNTELTAPYDIFQHTQYRENIKAMNVFTVANTHDLIRTFEGLYVKPDFDYTKDPLPHIDILVIPSAEHHMGEDLKDSIMIQWVKNVGERAMFVTSHCDGTFVLAKAGLLHGISCTTFPADINSFKEMFPALRVFENVLFVHDKNVITSVGGAKSFEAALYLVQLLYGKAVADKIARGLVIDWDLEQVKKVVVHQGNGFETL